MTSTRWLAAPARAWAVERVIEVENHGAQWPVLASAPAVSASRWLLEGATGAGATVVVVDAGVVVVDVGIVVVDVGVVVVVVRHLLGLASAGAPVATEAATATAASKVTTRLRREGLLGVDEKPGRATEVDAVERSVW